jgi:hypothetical protein
MMSAILVALLSVQGMAAAPKTPAPAQRLPAPEHVSAQTRQEVKTRMGAHSVTMQNLVRAVVLLDRPTVRVLAGRIADEEIIARAGAAREKQPFQLPARFFAEQDDLVAAARKLASAAVDRGDDRSLAEHFAAVTRTCVGCHSTYLHDPPSFRPAE